MAEFVCKVGDTTGRISQQLETAQSEAEARQKLAERGFYVFSVRNHFDILGQFARASGSRSIRPDDFLIFNQQFNTLVKAGLPILKALDLLAERAASPRLRPILIEVRERVRNGALLSEALEAQGMFPPVYITVISAGERSGNLSGVLEQYISYLRTSTGFRNRLITTLIYPCVLVLFACATVTYFITYALPQYAALYRDLQVPLPYITQVLLEVAAPLRSYFLVFAGLAAAGGVAVYIWTRSERGALAIDRLKPKIPVMGDIWLKAQIAQSLRTLSTLLAGGSPLVPALQTAARAIGSRLISTSVAHAAERVKGRPGLCTKALAEERTCAGAGSRNDRGGRSFWRACADAAERGGILRRGSEHEAAARAFMDSHSNSSGHGRCGRLHSDRAVPSDVLPSGRDRRGIRPYGNYKQQSDTRGSAGRHR